MAAETLRPDGQLSCSGLVTCDFLEHDEDPDVSSVTINATGNNTSTEYGVDFPTPSGNPTAGADLQEFRAGVEEFDSGQSGVPTARIELWENGVLVRAGPDTNIEPYQVLSFTWNASELTTADGSLVQCKVIGKKTGGSGSKRNTVRIGHIEWNAEVDTSNVVTGDGSSAGVATVTGDGVSTAAADGSSTGAATVTGDGKLTAVADGSSAGVATVTGDGVSTAAGDGSAAGGSYRRGCGAGGGERRHRGWLIRRYGYCNRRWRFYCCGRRFFYWCGHHDGRRSVHLRGRRLINRCGHGHGRRRFHQFPTRGFCWSRHRNR